MEFARGVVAPSMALSSVAAEVSLAIISGGGRRRSSRGWLEVDVGYAILEVDKIRL